jgi:hypothetical protein
MFKPSQIGRMPFQPLLDTQLIAVGLLLLLPLIARSLEPVAPSAGTDSAHHDLAGAAADIMYAQPAALSLVHGMVGIPDKFFVELAAHFFPMLGYLRCTAART